jgi:hypothetical protein
MYFQTGQVIFVPEWPKGEFVSILASFYVWTKSLMCKDTVNRDSTCHSIFRRLCTAKKIEDFRFPISRLDDMSSRPDAHLSTVPSVRTTCSSRPDVRQTSIIRPDNVSFPFGPYTESRSFYPACIRSDISAARPDAYQYLSSLIFFPSSNKGKIDKPSGQCGIPSGRASP